MNRIIHNVFWLLEVEGKIVVSKKLITGKESITIIAIILVLLMYVEFIK